MMASRFTGTVSRVKACSALKVVVWILSSMVATTLSTTGMIRNSPGPLTPRSLPARNTTHFCQVLAMRKDCDTMAAATHSTMAGAR